MSSWTDADLAALNARGLIPGPGESESAFRRRANSCPASAFSCAAQALTTYDIAPDWVALHYRNKGLRPWHAAVTWIEEDGRAHIQLRHIFKRKERFLGLYTAKEILTHELAHVGRSAFNEPLFEEFIAYKTDSSALRRLLGGGLLQPKDGALTALAAIALLLLGGDPLLAATLLCAALPALLAVQMCAKSLARRRLWARAKGRLQSIVPGKEEAVLYRLTDAEIHTFSRSTPQDILAYAHAAKDNSLRWRVIHLVYFA